MLLLLGDVAALRYLLGAFVGFLSLLATIYWIASWLWFKRKKRQINRSWDYYRQTGDSSKLDPESRAMLELAERNRPEFLKAVEERRAKAEAELARWKNQ